MKDSVQLIANVDEQCWACCRVLAVLEAGRKDSCASDCVHMCMNVSRRAATSATAKLCTCPVNTRGPLCAQNMCTPLQ
jgi:hypothetical protein